MPRLAFASVYLIPLAGAVTLLLGGPWTWLVPVAIFGLVPLAELFLPGDHRNAARDEEAARRADGWFDGLLYAALPAVYGLLLLLLVRSSAGEGALTGVALLGGVLTAGIVNGAIGINVAHELGHRARRRDQRVAHLLLLPSLYLHFFVEHNRGHHAHVATPDDPASARRGETLYAFWARSVVGSWRSAWRLEAERLGRAGRSPWSARNALVVYAAAYLVTLVAVAAVFGAVGLGAFVGAAVIGALLLETVNYVEHYGLSRERGPDGRYARVRPAHSWTSDRPLSRALLFELTRHADHHANPGRPYSALRHMPDAPELPTGYAGMVLLALFPPFFSAVMERRLHGERARLAAA